MKLEIGDAVVLKSGGPIMLIKYVYKEQKGAENCICVWIDDLGEIDSRHFPVETLIPVAAARLKKAG